MLYGIIAAIDQMPVSTDDVLDALVAAVYAAPCANSGQTVEYALTSRTLLFQPTI